MRTLGIVLIIVGLLAIALPYVTFTTKEKVLDIGPIEAVQEKKQSVPISPIIGAIILVAGAGVIVAGAKRK